jgi:hypothetical protein
MVSNDGSLPIVLSNSWIEAFSIPSALIDRAILPERKTVGGDVAALEVP